MKSPKDLYLRVRAYAASYFVRAAFYLHPKAAHSQCRRHIGAQAFLQMRDQADRRSRWVLGFAAKGAENHALELATRQVSGALRDTINHHGPITKKTISAATNRLVGLLLKS